MNIREQIKEAEEQYQQVAQQIIANHPVARELVGRIKALREVLDDTLEPKDEKTGEDEDE